MNASKLSSLFQSETPIDRGTQPEHGATPSPIVAAFDAVRGVPSRRDVLRGLTATWLGLGVAAVPQFGEAKARKPKKRRRPEREKPNKYGCLDFNAPCRRSTQCCSGVCAGKPGKKRCRAHNAGQCKAEHNGCNGLLAVCGGSGYCYRTTGKASFCGGSAGSLCVDCKRDAECQAMIGPGAACVVCPGCAGNGSNGTACYSAAA